MMASVGLLLFVPNVYASESFYGTSNFENIPSEISRHFPTTFDIKLQYTVGPWGIDELVPVIEVIPENAISYVQLDFEAISLPKNSIGRIPVTITVDPALEYEKIFLNVSFEGHTSQNFFKSGWTDSLILSLGPRDVISIMLDNDDLLCTGIRGAEVDKHCNIIRPSPYSQQLDGVNSEQVKCNLDLYRGYKTSDGKAFCATGHALNQLIHRGYAQTFDSVTSASVYGTDFIVKEYCPASDEIIQWGWFGYDKNPKVINTNIDLIYNSEEDSQVVEFTFDSITDVKSMIFVFVECKDNSEIKSFSQRYHISIFQNSKTMMSYVTPDFITIGPGEQVTWSNYDKIPHTITSNDPAHPWSTGTILPDGYSTITFEKTGIYEYHGKPGTNGVIVVMDDDGQLLESKFSNVFGHTSPIVYNEGLTPVFLYDNCERYAYWLTEHGYDKLTLPEDYPRYPPWGNQIFPLVEFCTNNGELEKTVTGNSIRWEFKIENEGHDYPFGSAGPMMNQETCNDFVISQWQPKVEDREMVQQFLEICIQREFLTSELVERGKIADNFTMGPIQLAQTLAEGDIEKTIKILEEMYRENEN